MTISPAARESILAAQVDAALDGHDIGPFEPEENEAAGWHAKCRRCGRSVWVSRDGLTYSGLGDRCPGRE